MNEPTSAPPAIKTVPKTDLVTATKTIYDVTPSEVFWRNFIAGVGRTMGALVLYFIFLFVIGMIVVQVVGPMFTPLMKDFDTAVESLERVEILQGRSEKVLESEEVQELIKQLD